MVIYSAVSTSPRAVTLVGGPPRAFRLFGQNLDNTCILAHAEVQLVINWYKNVSADLRFDIVIQHFENVVFQCFTFKTMSQYGLC